MGTVSVTTFSTDTETVTKTKLNGLAANLVTEFNGSIDNTNIKAAAGIDASKLDLTTASAIGSTAPSTGAFTTLSATGAVTLTNTATTADIAAIVGNSLTTGKGLSLTSTSTARTEDNLLHVTHVGDSAGANTGGVGYFESDDNDTGTRDVVGIKNTDASATGATCLGIDQVSTNAGVDVNCTGNGPHLRMIGDPTVASPTDGDLWFTGSALNFRNGASTVDLLISNIVQSIATSDATAATDAVGIPHDDTLPQVTEGSATMSQAITPSATDSTIEVTAIMYLNPATSANFVVAALFNTDVHATNAIQVGCDNGDNNRISTVSLVYRVLASSLNGTTETTFTLRYGGESNTTKNGVVGSRVFGGALISRMIVKEILA